jgi:branched-chain amino acid transport system substrate-binding protein
MDVKRTSLWMLAALAATAVHAAQPPAAPAADGNAVRVGLIAPLSGPAGEYGKSVRLGAQLAVNEINEVGGYLGRRFELVVRDDKASPEEGRRAAQDLVLRQKVNFTIGFCNTGVAMQALDVFQDNRHVLLTPCASGSAVTAKYEPSRSYIFRNAVPEQVNSRFLARELVTRRGLVKVAVLADSTGYGEGGLKDISAELKSLGVQPVYVGRFAPGVKDLSGEMKAARAAGAGALVVYAVGAEHAVAVRDRQAARLGIPYFATWPLAARSVLGAAGAKALEGTMMTQTVIQDAANERRASFILRFAKLAGGPTESLMAAAQSYDAVHLMLRAVFQARGELSGSALKQALENLQRPYQGVVTIYDKPFSDSDHDALSDNMLWLGIWRGGEVQFAHPEDARRSGFTRRKQQQG